MMGEMLEWKGEEDGDHGCSQSRKFMGGGANIYANNIKEQICRQLRPLMSYLLPWRQA